MFRPPFFVGSPMVSEDSQSIPAKQRTAAFLWKFGPLLATFILFGLGAFAVYDALHGISLSDVISRIKLTPTHSLILAVLATAGGYAALIGYDWSALRYVGKGVPLPTLSLGSFTAYALSNSIGLAVLSGGAVRYRFYRGLGLSLADITVVSTYCAMAFGIGVTVIGFAAIAWHPAAMEHFVPLSVDTIRVTALAAFAAVTIGVAWSSIARHPIGFGRFRFVMPPPRDAAFQILFSLLDIIFAAATLYILLPSGASAVVTFPTFVAVFAAAAVAAVLSHVPGGVGVFEAVILGAFATVSDQAAGIAAALLVYRIIYYLLPLMAGVLILVGVEIRGKSSAACQAQRKGAERSFGAFLPDRTDAVRCRRPDLSRRALPHPEWHCTDPESHSEGAAASCSGQPLRAFKRDHGGCRRHSHRDCQRFARAVP